MEYRHLTAYTSVLKPFIFMQKYQVFSGLASKTSSIVNEKIERRSNQHNSADLPPHLQDDSVSLHKAREDMKAVIDQLSAVIQSSSFSEHPTLYEKHERSAVYVSTGHSLASKIRRQRLYGDAGKTKDDISLPVFSVCSYIPTQNTRAGEDTLYEKISQGAWHMSRRGDMQTSFREYKPKQEWDIMDRKDPLQTEKIFTLELDKAWEEFAQKKEKKRLTSVILYKSCSCLLLLVSIILAIILIILVIRY